MEYCWVPDHLIQAFLWMKWTPNVYKKEKAAVNSKEVIVWIYSRNLDIIFIIGLKTVISKNKTKRDKRLIKMKFTRLP